MVGLWQEEWADRFERLRQLRWEVERRYHDSTCEKYEARPTVLYIVMAYVVMAYVVMAYLAKTTRRNRRCCPPNQPSHTHAFSRRT